MTPLVHVVSPPSLAGAARREASTRGFAVSNVGCGPDHPWTEGGGRGEASGLAPPPRLLDLDRRSRGFELLLRLVGLLLRNLLEHGLRRAVDQVLGFLEPEARERAHLLDHLDLL